MKRIFNNLLNLRDDRETWLSWLLSVRADKLMAFEEEVFRTHLKTESSKSGNIKSKERR